MQDPDVLDTWFSSALWPFSTLGWPEKTADFTTYYPTSALITGYDILFFWVARMIMHGDAFHRARAVQTVYLHSLVRTGTGEKMSKTAGTRAGPGEVEPAVWNGCDAVLFGIHGGAGDGYCFERRPAGRARGILRTKSGMRRDFCL